MRFIPLAMTAVLFVSCGPLPPRPAQPEARCPPVGRWVDPATRASLGWPEVVAAAARSRVVLLGEQHDEAEDHRWQLQTLAALRGQRRELAVGFEMFPRAAQAALDRWAAGSSGEREFLRDTDWGRVWAIDPELYLPLFHFVRMQRLPMVALNVDRALAARVGQEGWSAVPMGDREGIGDPAPAPASYLERLAATYREKRREGVAPGSADEVPTLADAAFARFVEAQLLWDRAMAEALAAAARTHPAALVVGIVGQGHAERGGGIPHQLAALGIRDVSVLLPWHSDEDCADLSRGPAHAVFGLNPPPAPPAPRLGVTLVPADGGVRVIDIAPGSVAAAARIRKDDVIVAAAGRPVGSMGDLGDRVLRQPPGSWLPLEVRRGRRSLAIVARFLPEE